MRLFKENKYEWLVVLIFAFLLTTLFFYQVFLGKIPVPSDVITGLYYPWLDYKWGSITQVAVKNSLLADAVTITYPFKLLAVQMIKNGEMPLWNHYVFGGYPFWSSPTVAILFPTTLFYLLFPFNVGLILQTASQPLIAFLSMYLLMRHFKANKLASIFSSVSYAFGGFIMVWLEWNWQATTCVFLPLLIFLEDNLIEKNNSKKCSVFFSLTVATQIFAGYLPVVGFTLIALIMYLLIKKHLIKNLFRFFKYYFLGLMLGAVYLIPYIEQLVRSQRVAEKLTVGEALTSPWNMIGMIIPDFFGNPRTGNSWGNGNYLNIAIYIGVAAIIMAIIGIKNNFFRKEVKYALALIILVFLVSYANPLSVWLFNLGIWGGTSNTMNRFFFVVNFALAILAGYGFSSINQSSLSTKIGTCLTLVLLIVGINLYFVGAKYFNLQTTLDITPQHLYVGVRNSVLPLLICLIVLALFIIDHKIRRFRVFTGLALISILLFELFRFGLKFNTFSSTKYLYPETPILQYLAQFRNERFVSSENILPANMWIPYHLESIGGYDAAYPMAIGKLIAAVNSGSANVGPQNKSGTIDSPGSKLLETANVRFILVKKGSLLFKNLLGDNNGTNYKLAFEDKSIAVVENINSLSRVFLVSKVVAIKNDGALSFLMSKDYRSGVAVTDEYEFQGEDINLKNIQVQYSRISNSKTKINVTSDKDSFLVVLDTYYPGWEASIDNVSTRLYKTNYAFMGVKIPAGNHVIELAYKPKSLYCGLLISLLSVVIIMRVGLKRGSVPSDQ